MNGFIQLQGGDTFFDFDLPSRSHFTVEDIAHGLSNMCRYSGQCKTFYSVAEHSLRVAEEMRQSSKSPKAQMIGLLHDASEAFIADIPTPAKRLLPQYQALEERVMDTIMTKLGFPDHRDYELIWKPFDSALLMTEMNSLFDRPARDGWTTWNPNHSYYPLKAMTQLEAKEKFLERYYKLQHELTNTSGTPSSEAVAN